MYLLQVLVRKLLWIATSVTAWSKQSHNSTPHLQADILELDWVKHLINLKGYLTLFLNEIDSCPHKSNLGSSVIVNCFDRSHWPELAAQWTRVLTTVTGPEDLRGRMEPRARPQLSASSHHTRAQHPEPETFSRSGLGPGPECSAAPLSVQSLQFCYYATSLNRKIALLRIAIALQWSQYRKELVPWSWGDYPFYQKTRPWLPILMLIVDTHQYLPFATRYFKYDLAMVPGLSVNRSILNYKRLCPSVSK